MINEVAKKIKKSKYIVTLTGAGISVDSGIPDFRSKGGIWEKYDPYEYANIESFKKDPEKVWKFLHEFLGKYSEVKPNPGHIALARLEEAGYLKTIITQNIDGLHQKSGSKNVIEIHGSSRELICLYCNKKYIFEEKKYNTKNNIPLCECGKILKPNVIFFGEQLPQKALEESFWAIENCDLLIVVGTSGVVAPVSNFPYIAKNNGAYIVEINLNKTPITSYITDYFLQGTTSRILSQLLEEVL